MWPVCVCVACVWVWPVHVGHLAGLVTMNVLSRETFLYPILLAYSGTLLYVYTSSG